MRAWLPIFIVLGACRQIEAPSQNSLGETTAQSESSETQSGGSDVLVTYLRAEARPNMPQPTFHAARLAGDLTVRHGCVGLVSRGNFVVLALAADEARWDQPRRQLVVRDIVYELGTVLEVGGSTSGGAAVGKFAVGPSGRCIDVTRWYVSPGSVAALRK